MTVTIPVDAPPEHGVRTPFVVNARLEALGIQARPDG
jgi:hypothetical protein